MSDSGKIVESADDLEQPVIIPVEAYLSADYARAERDRLWRKVWLQAGRVEDIPEPGDYLTFDVLDDSVLLVRSEQGAINAFHNVCAHRGRRLVDTPSGVRSASGRRPRFMCAYHGWQYDLDGKSADIIHKDDWQGQLTDECTSLTPVSVDTWGGWIWINLDPDCEPLADYLAPIPEMLDPFQLHNMRVRWRKWGIFDCNWKVAMEAFNETYHVQTTHPEFNKFGEFRGWARAQGKHSHIGYEAAKADDDNQKAKLRVGSGDARLSTAEMQVFTWEKANTNTTQTLVNAALRLKDELPEGTAPGEVLQHWLASARADDEARGVVWPTVDAEHVGKTGTAWQVFPNFQIGHAVNNMLCYSARPYGYDPDKCIFEGAVYELFPEGEEPQPEWEYCEATADAWCYVLGQDFSNMAAVQQGMKSAGFTGPKPNPYMERSTANLHRNLAEYMGTGQVRKLR
ncbi:MAG: aromatic ring-hydroxylating dioxygenase subunit alpha [Halioglobus sp.]|nr:aromatic ring-hydroxylating dioxygenase subunit alpha [Halioglobus sp.]